MAIAFSTGTINQPDAGSVGLSMVEQFRDDLIMHPAWELVEEYFPAGGLVRWYVFKCLASISGLESDFYFVVGRTLGDGWLRGFICEGYNPATHVVSQYAIATASGATTFDSVGRASQTFTLGTAVLPSATSGSHPKWVGWAPSGTSTKWWVIAADDGFSVAMNGAANAFFHCGAFTWLGSIPNPMPIQFMGWGSTGSAAQGVLTRNPAVANLASRSTALHGSFGGSSSVVEPLGFQGRMDVNDRLQADQRPVSEVGMTLSEDNAGVDRAVWGWAIGKQKRMRVGTAMPVGFTFGDAFVIEGRLWVTMTSTDTRLFDTGVAAS